MNVSTYCGGGSKVTHTSAAGVCSGKVGLFIDTAAGRTELQIMMTKSRKFGENYGALIALAPKLIRIVIIIVTCLHA